VARILREKGFDAYVIAGGLRAWRKARYPTELVPAEDVQLLPKFN
jgi:rhodanese-related sulfurtransferase